MTLGDETFNQPPVNFNLQQGACIPKIILSESSDFLRYQIFWPITSTGHVEALTNLNEDT